MLTRRLGTFAQPCHCHSPDLSIITCANDSLCRRSGEHRKTNPHTRTQKDTRGQRHTNTQGDQHGDRERDKERHRAREREGERQRDCCVCLCARVCLSCACLRVCVCVCVLAFPCLCVCLFVCASVRLALYVIVCLTLSLSLPLRVSACMCDKHLKPSTTHTNTHKLNNSKDSKVSQSTNRGAAHVLWRKLVPPKWQLYHDIGRGEKCIFDTPPWIHSKLNVDSAKVCTHNEANV